MRKYAIIREKDGASWDFVEEKFYPLNWEVEVTDDFSLAKTILERLNAEEEICFIDIV